MTSKEHKKHTALIRPGYGNFGLNEWAIVGTHCHAIKALAGKLLQALSADYKCAYIDAQHQEEANQLPAKLQSGASIEYIDQINYRQFNYNQQLNSYQLRQHFAGMDCILVNGNHHEAKAQIVVIDASKKGSLQKRMNQLSNVKLILLADGKPEIFDFVKESQQDVASIPVLQLHETEKIIAFFKEELQQRRPQINGLVLAGGKSMRMGEDKAAINLYGKQQQYYLADMLKNYCGDVFISCRQEQVLQIQQGYSTLTDTFTGLGPMGAILSAFREQPEKAWLVVACDLPLLDANTLDYLVQNRKTSAIATAYQSPHDDFPEPLITIWEPKSYPVLLSFLAQGYSCPRKVLINSDINLLRAPHPEQLTNVNTPEELENIKKIILQKTSVL